MADFLSRLATRSLGFIPVVQPLIPSLFAAGPTMLSDNSLSSAGEPESPEVANNFSAMQLTSLVPLYNAVTPSLWQAPIQTPKHLPKFPQPSQYSPEESKAKHSPLVGEQDEPNVFASTTPLAPLKRAMRSQEIEGESASRREREEKVQVDLFNVPISPAPAHSFTPSLLEADSAPLNPQQHNTPNATPVLPAPQPSATSGIIQPKSQATLQDSAKFPVSDVKQGIPPHLSNEQTEAKTASPNLPSEPSEAISPAQRFPESTPNRIEPLFNPVALSLQPDDRQPGTPERLNFQADAALSEAKGSNTPSETSAFPSSQGSIVPKISQPTIRAAIPPLRQRLEHQAAPRSDARSNLKETIQSATEETVSRDQVLGGDSDSPVQATETSSLQATRPLAKVAFTAQTPPLSRGETNSLPLIRGGLGWGALYFGKRSTVGSILPRAMGESAELKAVIPNLPIVPPHLSQSKKGRVEPLLNSIELGQQRNTPDSSAPTGSKPQTSLKASTFRQQDHSTTSLTTASTPQTSTLEPTSNVKHQPSMVGRREVLTKISPTLSSPTAFNHPAAPVQDEAAASDSPPLLARFTHLLRHSATRYESSRDVQPVPLVRSQLSSPPEIEPPPQAHLNSRRSMLSERRESALAQEASTPSIQVTIGRIEIRTTKSPPPSTPRSQPAQRGATLSLNDYLKQRHGGKP